MIYTGYYSNMKKAPPEHGLTFYSISRGNPSWFPYPLRDIEILKPSWELVDMAKHHNYEEYLKLYAAQLNKVSLRDVKSLLVDEAILLCYETPDKFCHRHIVRNWLNKQGILCSELTFMPNGDSVMVP
jgi:hypothetical protein